MHLGVCVPNLLGVSSPERIIIMTVVDLAKRPVHKKLGVVLSFNNTLSFLSLLV